jgi:hypothetical protein
MEAQPQVTPEPTLAELVRAVYEARITAGAEEDTVKALEERFRKGYREDFERRDLAREAVSIAEAALREAALKAYDGENKQIGPGITEADVTHYDYPIEQALSWALEHKQCLALDAAKFGAVCKSDELRPDFVSKKTVKTVKLASDLSKAVEEWDKSSDEWERAFSTEVTPCH